MIPSAAPSTSNYARDTIRTLQAQDSAPGGAPDVDSRVPRFVTMLL